MNNSVTAFAPATVANVGSAFDVLGFALEAPGDVVSASITAIPGVVIKAIHGDGGRLPLATNSNTAGVSVIKLLEYLEQRDPAKYASIGISLELTKGLPLGSGLGSSSASTVAALVAAHELLGAPLSRKELLPFAMEGERVACGSAHADNVGPCLLGGFVVVRSYHPLEVIELPTPSSCTVVVVTPHIEVRTADARRILKKAVPLDMAIGQWGNVAALVAGIFKNDLELIGRALEDAIIEPERGQLIPGYSSVKQAAHDNGAYGCSISGSGPSIFAFCKDNNHAQSVARAMAASFENIGIRATQHISAFNRSGAKILEKR